MINVLGRIFPSCFFFFPGHHRRSCSRASIQDPGLPYSRKTPRTTERPPTQGEQFGSGQCPERNDPRLLSGVISFPWVQSLGNLAFCWIDRAFCLVGISSEAFMFLSLLFAIGIYVKRKILKPSRQVSLPYLVSPFFVPSVYHALRLFSRRDFSQITSG